MKLFCKGRYHNDPAGLHFERGVIEVDDWKGEFLLRDAPENFSRELPGEATVAPKAIKAPPKDKAVKAPAVDK